MTSESELSRRERQIMDIVYARGTATAKEVVEALPDAPTRTAVRTLLGILEEKGWLKHDKQGREFVYRPVRPRLGIGRSALKRVIATFFEGSLEKALAAHLADDAEQLSDQQYKDLTDLIRQARKKAKEK